MPKFDPPNHYNVKKIIESWNKEKEWKRVMNAENAVKWESPNKDEAYQVWFNNQNGSWTVTHIAKNEKGEWIKHNLMGFRTREAAVHYAKSVIDYRYKKGR